MSKKFLILGNDRDDHAAHICGELMALGHWVRFVDLGEFPHQLEASIDPVADDIHIRFHDGESVELGDVHSVYWRNYNHVPNFHGTLLDNGHHAHICENDSRSLVESILLSEKTKWVNGWEGFQLHQRKPYALQKVAKLGVKVPRTLISNDPKLLREFAAKEPKAIFKPVQGGVHTKKLKVSEFTDEMIRSLQVSPITFQEEIPGTNIRVFVAGEAIIAVEVKTNEIDFRDDQRPQIHTVDIPPAIATQSKQIAATLGLRWTGIDFRLTDEGDYVFLEANPSPMFIGFERASGAPLTQVLLDLLVS